MMAAMAPRARHSTARIRSDRNARLKMAPMTWMAPTQRSDRESLRLAPRWLKSLIVNRCEAPAHSMGSAAVSSLPPSRRGSPTANALRVPRFLALIHELQSIADSRSRSTADGLMPSLSPFHHSASALGQRCGRFQQTCREPAA